MKTETYEITQEQAEDLLANHYGRNKRQLPQNGYIELNGQVRLVGMRGKKGNYYQRQVRTYERGDRVAFRAGGQRLTGVVVTRLTGYLADWVTISANGMVYKAPMSEIELVGGF